METIIVRDVRKEDIEKVVTIQIEGWKTAYKGIIDDEYLMAMNKEEKIRKRKKDYQENGFIVAQQKEEIVGFCRYSNQGCFSKEIKEADCELLAIYVKANLKHHGIGRKMFEYVKEQMKNEKKTKMILWCLKDNKPSQQFYKKMGGIIIKERQIKIGEKSYAEVCFAYDL